MLRAASLQHTRLRPMSSEQMSWLMNAGFKTLLGALSGARLALLAVSVFCRCGMMWSMMGGGLIGGYFSLLFCGLAVGVIAALVVVWLVNQARRR